MNGEIVKDSSLFEEIMKSCTEKKVVSRCKKLIKKCTLTSGAVATTLEELEYWLYIYEHNDGKRAAAYSDSRGVRLSSVHSRVAEGQRTLN